MKKSGSKIWKKSEAIFRLNPTGEVPILENKNTSDRYVDSFIIAEFLVSMYNGDNELLIGELLSKDENIKAEIRRIEMLFDKNFYYESAKCILEEKVYNSFLDEKKMINNKKYKIAQKNMEKYLGYVDYLLNTRDFTAKNTFSLADISIASQISSLDYLGEINWTKYQKVKDWYRVIKSKPSFRPILEDKIEGFKPSKNYNNIDFK